MNNFWPPQGGGSSNAVVTNPASGATQTVIGGFESTFIQPSGLIGATSGTRLVGATASGAPTTGTFDAGDMVIARDGSMQICIQAGTPGQWATQQFTQPIRQYGVSWNTSSGVMTRLGDAVGLTAPTSFDSLSPWSGMRRCNLSDAGVVNAYYGDATYSDAGSNGQVMVEMPEFWYQKNTTSSGFEFWIADGPASGFTLHPAFYRDLTGSGTATAVTNRYYSAYEGYLSGSLLESVSGVTPTVSQSLDTFRTAAQARGSGWGIAEFNLLYAVQMLYLVEYASFDSQTLLGQGYTSAGNTAPIATGTTASNGNTSTIGSDSAQTTGTAAMSYRGIENLYGNIYKWVDGCVTSGTSGSTPITIRIGNAAFNDTGSGYGTSYTSAAVWSNAVGYETNIWGDPRLGFTPSAFAGSSSTGLFDYGSLHSGSVPIFGGYWPTAAAAGAFCLYVYNAPSSVYSDIGARLAY